MINFHNDCIETIKSKYLILNNRVFINNNTIYVIPNKPKYN